MTTIGLVFGFIGAALTVASYLMRGMLPLRVLALGANLCLVVYAFHASNWPIMGLYLAMIPINIFKIVEIRRLKQAIERSRSHSPLHEWLLPQMRRREVPAGTVLWSRGDVAEDIVYLDRGRLHLVELGKPVEPGSLIGEIGMFAPERRRTSGVVCETDCTLYTMSAGDLAQLYYQEPRLGWQLVRLVVGRLLQEVQEARQTGSLGSAAGTTDAALTPPVTGRAWSPPGSGPG